MARSRDEVGAGLERTLSFSAVGEAIVEEFLEGPEVSASIFVLDGQVAVCQMSDRLALEGYPGGIPRAHRLPSQAATPQDAAAVTALLDQLVAALRIRQGPAYAQLKLTSGGPRLIEMSPRLDGCYLWRLVRAATGIDLLAATATLLGGGSPDLQAVGPLHPMSLLMLHRPPGAVFREVDVPMPAAAVAWGFHYREGEVVRPVNGFMETVGYCLVAGA